MKNPLNISGKVIPVPNLFEKVKSVLLVDGNELDNFINRKILNLYGVIEITSFVNTIDALQHLKTENVKYQLILVDIYFPIMDGFKFIDKFNELGLYKTHGEVCILTASVNPLHRKTATQRKINFIEKPLTIENLIKSL